MNKTYRYKRHKLVITEEGGDIVGTTKSVWDGLNNHFIYANTEKEVRKQFRLYIDKFLHKSRI